MGRPFRRRSTCGRLVPVNLSALHHECHAPERGDVLDRIALDGDEVGVHAGGDGADPIGQLD
jgi:hypothetical protein